VRAKAFKVFHVARAVLPYLWGFALAAALDHVIHVQALFQPVLACAAMVNATSLVLRRIEQ
jgi:hypothetical protein